MSMKSRQWSTQDTRRARVLPCDILECGPELLNHVGGETACLREEGLHGTRKDGRWGGDGVVRRLHEKNIILEGGNAGKK
jgi:hypothetical protein